MQKLLIVTDIFGRGPALKPLLQALTTPERNITLLDPYGGREQMFATESDAYSAFITECGHDAYAAKVESTIAESAMEFELALGFSAGASALWRVLATASAAAIQRAVLFYPGQIHQHLALQPRVPVSLIFGQTEPHFQVAALCQQLAGKVGVTTHISPYQHGFINPASSAFSVEGAREYLTALWLGLAVTAT